MTRVTFVLLILWMFGLAAVYGAIALHPMIRAAWFQWLGFIALLIAPGVYMGWRSFPSSKSASAPKSKSTGEPS